MVVDVQTVVLNLKEISFFFECPRYTQQRVQLFNQFNDISVPFHINYILYGSSDFSYNLNCKILSYVHSYIIASKRFWLLLLISTLFNYCFLQIGWIMKTLYLCLSVGINEWGDGFINVGMNVFLYMVNNKLTYNLYMTKVKFII